MTRTIIHLNRELSSFIDLLKRMSFETGFQFMLGMADIQIGL